MAQGEIRALLESPELRRIFDDEPAPKGRARPAQTGKRNRAAADGSDRAPEWRAAPRGSRKRRILIGLAPLYLAGLILFFETVREPSLFVGVVGSPSVAEEQAGRTSAVIFVPELRGGIGATEISTTAESEAIAQPVVQSADLQAAGQGPAAPMETATEVALADATESEKAAIDLGKGAPVGAVAQGAAAERQVAPGDASAELPVVLPASVRRFPDIARDPSAGPVQSAGPFDPAVAQAAEEALRLSRGDRREIQRRLRLAASDPKGVDGIFGPATRSALAVWQERAGLPATGFIDEATMALLVEATADEYRAWRAAERARAREREAQTVVASSARPPAPQPQPDACRRTASGEIAFGRDVGCNFRAFGANLKRDLRDLRGNIRGLFK